MHTKWGEWFTFAASIPIFVPCLVDFKIIFRFDEFIRNRTAIEIFTIREPIVIAKEKQPTK